MAIRSIATASFVAALCFLLSGVAAADDDTEKKVTGDWTMWGGTPSRNMVNQSIGLDLKFNFRDGTNIKWIAPLGSQTYGNAIVADGFVIVGTNNAHEYRPKHKVVKDGERTVDNGDRGCLIAFDEKDGSLKWQLTRQKLETGRVNDWLEQGICSTPFVDKEKGVLWVVTNRCELMCVDLDGFHDGTNDGIQTEDDVEMQDADIIWSLDMIDDLGVFPHNLATSSPIVAGDTVYVLTSNGVDEAHIKNPSPRAPSFLAVNKNTGEVKWESNAPFDKILHGQWSSPAVGEVNGQTQIYFPGGDGWLYAFGADGKEIWRFDLNPKETKWELGGAGTRNAIISTPVFYDNSVLLAVGQDPEHGEGLGHFWRIDATKTGDISAEIGKIGAKGKPNPKSGVIWHYGGVDTDGEITGTKGTEVFHRTMSTASVHDGMVFLADLSGRVHCIDYETGKRHWEHDMLSGVWGSTMVVDGKVFIGNEDGKLTVIEADKSEAKVIAEYDTVNYSSIYSTPTFANGRMYVTDRNRMYAVEIQ